MKDLYDESEFQEGKYLFGYQDWQYLFSYSGTVLDFEFYYRFEKLQNNRIRVRLREEVAGSESCTDALNTIDEAKEYVEQYKEKLMTLVSCEESLDF